MVEREIKRAIFSDTTEEYVTPSMVNQGDTVKIRLRALKNTVSQVLLVTDKQVVTMSLEKRNVKGFSYYQASYVMTAETLEYYFKINIGDSQYVYDARGLVEEYDKKYAFRIIPGFDIPKWAKGGVFYQIYVDRFCNGDKSNDVLSGEYRYIDTLTEHREWNENITSGISNHYGGDLQGVIDKLDYIKDLGIEAIYLNPIFVSPSNHKYDTADYDYVDPHYGVILKDEGELLDSKLKDNAEATRFISRITSRENLEASNELFSKLVDEAHARGIKVILDGVFNHCGSLNKWMDAEGVYSRCEGYEKGACVSKDSPYHDYFTFTEDDWPNNRKYESWWGFDTLPKLNYECRELYDYILKIGAKWVSAPYNADGWRLDVAADLGPNEEVNHRFWADFRKSVKAANPDAIILAEHYGDPSSWLDGKQWDTVMNYDAFMEPVSWFLTGMEKHNDEYRDDMLNNQNAFWESMRNNGAKFNCGSLQSAMNQLSNHDHSRFLTRTTGKVGRIEKLGREAAEEGIDKGVLREAIVMQMTWPGAPTVYYGDEAGVCGFTDPDNRRVYPWGKEDEELINLHKEAIRIHREHEELRTGSLIPIPTPQGTIAYGRKLKDDVTLVIVNNMKVAMEYHLPVWMLGIGKYRKYKTLLVTNESGYVLKGKNYRDSAGVLNIILEPNSSIIMNCSKKKKEKEKNVKPNSEGSASDNTNE